MARRIVILTIGTRGDVQPFAALARGLKRAGYAVRLAVPENFQDWVTSLGIESASCGGDFKAFVQDPETLAFLSAGLVSRVRHARAFGLKMFEAVVGDAVRASADADALICHPKIEFACDIAEAKGIPVMMAGFQPITPTRDFPMLTIPARTLGGVLNRLTYKLLYLSRWIYFKDLNRWRRDLLGLGPASRLRAPFTVNGTPIPVLYGFSRHVMPPPRDWPANVYTPGYWFLDAEAEWRPDAALDAFLGAGSAPIYIGFGSMPGEQPKTNFALLQEALERTGLRAVVATGWGGVDAAAAAHPDHVHVVDAAPHEHLFPLMRGVVHHGGAGTTAAGLRAGRPTLICPFLVDQPFWGRRVAALGAGPPPLPPKRWTVERLAAALTDLAETDTYRAKAAAVGHAITEEDGIEHAVDAVRKELGSP